MNAVKRCLALIAATLVVGACSGDPTADLAGSDLSIRVSPGAVWMQQDKTTTVTVEVIDATGSPMPGTWTASTTGPIVATLDEDYQNTNGGAAVGNASQFVVSATAEGEGTVTFTGTGGPLTIPVRVAPAATAFHVTISNLNPAIAETLTVTAPAGIRFTSTTAVSFVTGATNTVNNGLATPALVSMAADSLSLRILPAPNAAGHLRITDVASISSPTLKSTANSFDSVHVATLLSVAATFSSNPVAANAPLTVTMPVGTKLRPTSAFNMAGQPALGSVVVLRAADSNSAVIIPAPGFRSQLSITALRDVRVGALSLTLPSFDTLKTTLAATAPGHVPHGGADDARGVPTIAAANGPSTVGGATGITAHFDSASFSATDYTGDCGAGCGPVAQYIRFTANRTGNVQITLDWTPGTATSTDLDFVLLVDNGVFSTRITPVSGSSFVAATGAKPEVGTWALTSGTTYVLGVIDFAKSGADGAGFAGLPASGVFRFVFVGQ